MVLVGLPEPIFQPRGLAECHVCCVFYHESFHTTRAVECSTNGTERKCVYSLNSGIRKRSGKRTL